MKKRASQLLCRAARLADASTLDADRRAKILNYRDEAKRLLAQREGKLRDLERAASHPATQHTAAAWGAPPGEPLHLFPRALRRTLLEMSVSVDVVNQLVNTERQGEDKGEGKKGVDNKGGRTGEKGGRKRKRKGKGKGV